MPYNFSSIIKTNVPSNTMGEVCELRNIAEKGENNSNINGSIKTSTTDEFGTDNIRGTWGNKFESMLTLVGYTVGLGNIWRFPYLCYKNGGGVFMIPFLLFLLVCGLPLYYLEVCLGQFSGKNPIQVWAICPLFQGIGFVMMIVSAIFIWYYGMVIGWVYFYLIQSCYPTLGWSTCNNTWNTPNCREIFDKSFRQEVNTTLNETDINTTNTAATEFWKYRVLNLSDGIDDLGHIQWHLLGSLFLGWFILFLCLCKGVKTVGKVVYVTVLVPYFLLTVLFVRGVTLDGAWEGIKLYITPDFSRLKDPQIWQDAAVQVFYSLGPAWGGVITISSFSKFHNNAFRDTAITCFADAFTAIFSGLPVFAVLGFLSKETGKPLDYFQSSGPGLVFIAYPEALSRLPLPQFWSVLFFFTLILVGIDTSFATTETLSATVVDIFNLHRYKVQTVAVIVFILFLVSTPLAMSGGFYMFLLADWYVGTFNIVILALLETIIVGWIYGGGRFAADIELMTGNRPNTFIRLAWCLLMPLFVTGITILTAANLTAPFYGKGGYVFPDYAVIIGSLTAFIPVSMVLVGVIFLVYREQGTLFERIRILLKPSDAWLPNDSKAAEQYRSTPYTYQRNIKHRILTDVFGFKHEHQYSTRDNFYDNHIDISK